MISPQSCFIYRQVSEHCLVALAGEMGEIRSKMANDRSNLQEIFELAECLARLGGYRHLSYRGLAGGTGLKTAQIQNHFPSKEHLAIAVVQRFGERVFERLGRPDDPAVPPEIKLDALIDVYRDTITDDGQLCLFLVFGAELFTLPRSVQDEVRKFYSAAFFWLETVLSRFEEYSPESGKDSGRAAQTIIAALNGAQICVRASNDVTMFDGIIVQLRASGVLPSNRSLRQVR